MPSAQGDINVATKLCRIFVHTCTCTFILKESVGQCLNKKVGVSGQIYNIA